jgi:lysophospholipid acyltransferase (LPLAT)-like uncharacterized protein
MSLRERRRRLVMALAVSWGWRLLSLLHRLVRVEAVGREHFEAIRASGDPLLIAIWHGRILLPILEHRDQGITPLISLSRDGEMITRTIEKLGYRSIRGSSSRGGSNALAALIELLGRRGEIAAIMPDGPRGPRHRLKPGTARIARATGAWVLPMSWAGERAWSFSSWDRFQLWKPFSRAVVIYGEPFRLPADEDFAAQQEQLRAALLAVEQQADAWFREGGRP